MAIIEQPLQSDSGLETSGNVVAGNVLTDNYLYANGAPIATYTDANVSTYLSGGTDTAGIVTTGNVSGAYLLGNVSQATGLGNVSTVNLNGNSSTYLTGNGSWATPAPGYTDSDVSAYLAGGTNTANIITTGNVSGGYVFGNISQATGLGNIVATNLNGNASTLLSGDGTWVAQGSFNEIPAVYFTAGSAGNGQTFSNVVLGSYSSNTSFSVFRNGTLLPLSTYSLSGDVLTVNTYLALNDTIDIPSQIAGNVTNVISGYGNSNVSVFLGSTGVPAVVANSLSSSSTTLTIDPSNDSSPATGNVVVLGNLSVTGNVTYTNISVATTSNLIWQAANAASTAADATGAGLAVGPAGAPYASWLYNNTSNVWTANIGVSAAGNVSGANFNTAGLVSATGNVAAGNVSAVGNVTGAYILGNGSQLTGITSTTIVNGTSNVSIPVANSSINFNVAGVTVGDISSTATKLPVRGDSGNVNYSAYFNPGTQEITYGPAMAAFNSFQAPLNGGTLTSGMMGQWIQAGGNITLPASSAVPTGTVWSIYGLATAGITITVNNTGTDFIYCPPMYGATTTSIKLFQGQWVQILSRGTGEWDVIASNLQEPQKVSGYVTQNAVFGMDNTINFRYNGSRLQFSPYSGSMNIAGQSIMLVTGSGPVGTGISNNTYTSGTWYDAVQSNMTISGSTAEVWLGIFTANFNRQYRATCLVDSTNYTFITIERLMATA